MKCARELKIKPVDDMIQRMGLTEEELDALSGDMTSALGDMEGLMMAQNDGMDDGDDEDGKQYDAEILDDGVLVTCRKCGASRLIPTDSNLGAHAFLNSDALYLE